MARAVLVTLTVALLLTCAPLTPLQKLSRMAKQTRVCVDNTSFHSMRVEILDSATGTEFGEMDVSAGKFVCEWMYLPKSKVDAKIKSVSVHEDVIPPAWRRMRVLGPTMELVVGIEGLTPFAHSTRRR